MSDPRGSAPDWQVTGRRVGKFEETSPGAIGAMTQILTSEHRLRHISTPWATRLELALALGCHIDTVTRRCRRAGVIERVVITPQNKARLEFLTDDVRCKVVRCAS
jgi:hypothetical protein